MPNAIKQALNTIIQNVAFKNDGDFSSQLTAFNAWATAVTLSSITAVFEQGDNVIFDTNSLNYLRQYLTVTAIYSNGSSAVLSGYELTGTLTEGTSEITATYEGKSASFNVLVKHGLIANGTYAFATTGEEFTITEGNHFKCDFTTTGNQNLGNRVNLSAFSKNGADSKANSSATDNLSDILYNIPAGAEVVFTMSNASKTWAELVKTSGSGAQLVLNFRKTGANTSALSSAIGYPTETSGVARFTSTTTFSEATDISCLFMFFSWVKNVSFEFDLTMTVNGERVI